MTNQEALRILIPIFDKCKGNNGCLGYIEKYFSKTEEKALDMAIKALESYGTAEWMYFRSKGYGSYYMCTHCKEKVGALHASAYCPHCGFRMVNSRE